MKKVITILVGRAGIQKRLIGKGDFAFLLRLGTEPKGIFGFGEALDEPFDDDDWGHSVNISWSKLVDPEGPENKEMLSQKLLQKQFPYVCADWHPLGSGISIPDDVASQLQKMFLKQKLFQCNICGKSYPTMGALGAHKEFIHNILFSPQLTDLHLYNFLGFR